VNRCVSARTSVDAAAASATDSAKAFIASSPGWSLIPAQAGRRLLRQALPDRTLRPLLHRRAAMLAAHGVEQPDAAARKDDHRRPVEARRDAGRCGPRAQRVDLLRLEREVRMMAVRGQPV